MKTCLLLSAFLWMAAGHLLASNPSDAKDEWHDAALKLSIESMSPSGNLKIGLHNDSAQEIHVWTGSHSWAYFNWRVIVVRGDEVRVYCPYPHAGFTMNFPQCVAIKPKEMITEDLRLGSDKWKEDGARPLPHWRGPPDTDPLLQSGDKIIVLYDVRWSEEANVHDVWTGITEVSTEWHFK